MQVTHTHTHHAFARDPITLSEYVWGLQPHPHHGMKGGILFSTQGWIVLAIDCLCILSDPWDWYICLHVP